MFDFGITLVSHDGRHNVYLEFVCGCQALADLEHESWRIYSNGEKCQWTISGSIPTEAMETFIKEVTQ